MTELGEGAAVDLIDVDHDAESCPCCQQTAPVVALNVFVAHNDEDAVAARDNMQWIRFNNAPDTLGGQLDPAAVYGLRRVRQHYESGDDLALAMIPHHLIPGATGLQRSTLVSAGLYLRSDGSAPGNIGYDVNCAANGVWVPSNHAYRPWGPEGAIFTQREGLAAQEYCRAAIAVCHAQFHDSHESYSEIVRDALDRLQAEVQHHAAYVCPHAPTQGAPGGAVTGEAVTAGAVTGGAVTVVVQRVHALSSRVQRLVCFPTTGWKAEVFLSRASQQYMIEHEIGGD